MGISMIEYFNIFCLKILLVCGLVISQSQAGEYDDLLFLSYKTGDYEFVEKSDNQMSYMYKGFLREYGLINEPVENAKIFYSKLSSPLREYRNFMFCFLFCEEELDILYDGNVSRYSTANIIYAIFLNESGVDCESSVLDKKACLMADMIYKKNIDSKDIYRSIAISLMGKVESERIYEISFYLLKKSMIKEGGDAAIDLATMYYWAMWVPKDCKKVRELTKDLGVLNNKFVDCI